MYASLDWLPSLVGGGLAGCGFCLVWYRLRRLERLYRTVWLGDEGSQDAPRCRVCRRWLFAETLAASKRLDDAYCTGCGGYNGPKPDDDDPLPIPVAVDDAQTQRFVVVSDEDSPDPPPGCPDCGRTFFAESLESYRGLDDDDKRDYCSSCGGYNGPEPKDDDDPPPPVPVAVDDAICCVCVVVSDEPAPSPPKLAVVREDDPPPPVSVAIAEPAPTLLRMGTPHAEHCDCEVCLLNRRIAMDAAQAQTLGMIDDLAFLRQSVKTLRLTTIDELDLMSRRIAKRLGNDET